MVGRVARLRPDKDAGIVVDFQDIYERDQQPILLQHIFDEITYRQGGLVAAPQYKKNEEAEKLDKKIRVKLSGEINVSFDVKNVFALDPTDVDFNNKKLLREILSTRPDVDFNAISMRQFAKIRFNHPIFHGSGMTLLHKAFGIRHTTDSKFHLDEDYRGLLDFVFEGKSLDSSV